MVPVMLVFYNTDRKTVKERSIYMSRVCINSKEHKNVMSFRRHIIAPPPHGFWVSGENGYLFSGSWEALVIISRGAQWLSGRVLDSRPKGRRFEPHRRRCVVSLSKNINPSLELVQPRKTCPFITERLLRT